MAVSGCEPWLRWRSVWAHQQLEEFAGERALMKKKKKCYKTLFNQREKKPPQRITPVPVASERLEKTGGATGLWKRNK